MRALRLLAVVFLFVGCTAYAQQDSTTKDSSEKQLYLVVKNDGAEYYGYIISDDGREILLETKTIGKIYIAKSEIKQITPVNNSEIKVAPSDGYTDYRNEGPFTTRYYFTTNGMPIKKSENYALIQLYGPEVHFAVSDNLSVGIMASWIASPIGLATKYSFNSEGNTHFALGTIIASSGYLLNAQGYGGLHWATVTQGTRSSNFSISAGYAYADVGDNYLGSIGEQYQDIYYSDRNGKRINYSAEGVIREQLFGADFQYEDHDLYKGFSPSYVVGLSGIIPVGKKASFILDAMGFIAKAKTVMYDPYPISVTYVNDQSQTVTEPFVISKGRIVEQGTNVTLIVMPAMRFSKSYTQAFQVALSGVILVQPDDVFSFPVPMVSWLRQF